MTGTLTRRVQRLENSRKDRKHITTFWSGPQDDEAIAKKKQEAERLGSPLLVYRWQTSCEN